MMGLVLTRQVGEEVNVGDLLKIKVLKISGSEVRLHFDAPPEVRVMRAEIDDLDPRNQSKTDAA